MGVHLPSKKMMLVAFLIFPFICFIKTIFAGWNEYSGNIWFVDKDVSWKYVLPDAVLFSVFYVITKNAAVPILLHIANNFSAIIVPMIAGIYSLVFSNAKTGIMGIPLLVVIVMFGCFLWGMTWIHYFLQPMQRTSLGYK